MDVCAVPLASGALTVPVLRGAVPCIALSPIYGAALSYSLRGTAFPPFSGSSGSLIWLQLPSYQPPHDSQYFHQMSSL